MTPRSTSLLTQLSDHVVVTGHHLEWVEESLGIKCVECSQRMAQWNPRHLELESPSFRGLVESRNLDFLESLSEGSLPEFFSRPSSSSIGKLLHITKHSMDNGHPIEFHNDVHIGPPSFSYRCFEGCTEVVFFKGDLENPRGFQDLLGRGLDIEELKAIVLGLGKRFSYPSRFERMT